MLYQNLSSQIIGAFITVHKALGPGLLEAPYHNALFYELRSVGLGVVYNAPYPVYFKGQQIGDYFADLAVEDKIIIEVKSAAQVSDVHRAQLVNYLQIAGLKVGFVANFHGSKVAWQRLVV
jgi:GxxExxY protein